MLRFLPCAHQEDIRLHTKHFVIKADQFLQSLFVFDPPDCSRLKALA